MGDDESILEAGRSIVGKRKEGTIFGGGDDDDGPVLMSHMMYGAWSGHNITVYYLYNSHERMEMSNLESRLAWVFEK